jgi:hypothetical protein
MTDNPFSTQELDELATAEQLEMQRLAEPFTLTIEVRPTTIPLHTDATIADFTWAVRISHKTWNRIYAVGGEPEGPLKAVQRAIDHHAFQIDLPA